MIKIVIVLSAFGNDNFQRTIAIIEREGKWP